MQNPNRQKILLWLQLLTTDERSLGQAEQGGTPRKAEKGKEGPGAQGDCRHGLCAQQRGRGNLLEGIGPASDHTPVCASVQPRPPKTPGLAHTPSLADSPAAPSLSPAPPASSSAGRAPTEPSLRRTMSAVSRMRRPEPGAPRSPRQPWKHTAQACSSLMGCSYAFSTASRDSSAGSGSPAPPAPQPPAWAIAPSSPPARPARLRLLRIRLHNSAAPRRAARR